MDLNRDIDEQPITTNGSIDGLDSISSPPSLSASDAKKVNEILQAAAENDVDSLAALATSPGGLVEDQVRKTAWPVLLGCRSTAAETNHEDELAWTSLPPHREEEQVQKDVDRSFVFYPTDRSEKHIEARRQELSSLIVEVLRRHPQLHYFQGFHDIVQVILLVLGPDDSSLPVRRLSLLRIRDFMLPSITAAVPHLNLLPAILYAADRPLYHHLLPTNPFFALSATLTLYAHNIELYSDIARLFDFLLAHDASTPIYFFASIILLRRDELLAINGREEPEILQFTLQKLPQPLDLEDLIDRSVQLKTTHPPEKLPFRAWKKVSEYSVLKTTRDRDTLEEQTLKDGEALFEKQAFELKRQQAIDNLVKTIRKTAWKYRREATWASMAVAVTMVALWMGRRPHFWNELVRRLPLPRALQFEV